MSRHPVRRASFPSADAPNILRNVDALSSPPMALVKHGKYIAFGVGASWWVGLNEAVPRILERKQGWTRRIMLLGLGLHGVTIIIFLYLVLFLPWFRGYIPNYPQWQQSARLRSLVPILTLTILLGWSSYVISLSQAGKSSAIEGISDKSPSLGSGAGDPTRRLGVFSAMLGATAAYTLTFGLLGLIPAPRNTPIRDKKQ